MVCDVPAHIGGCARCFADLICDVGRHTVDDIKTGVQVLSSQKVSNRTTS
jgi:hypothetical protein